MKMDNMPDREKVIKGLEACSLAGTKEDCIGYGCPYLIYNDEVSDDCQEQMFDDAITLLKAQEVPISESISSAIECLLHPQDAYDSDMAKAIDTAVRAMRLLKAQEPRVEPRVMTVDEVRMWISVPRIDREPIWVEIENSVNAWIVSDEYWDMQIDVNLSSDLYGKKWRCWTSRPTDEQREATTWE